MPTEVGADSNIVLSMDRTNWKFGKDCIDCLVNAREFVNKERVGWLNSIKFRHYLRVRKNFKVTNGNSNREIEVIYLVCHLVVGEYSFSSSRYKDNYKEYLSK